MSFSDYSDEELCGFLKKGDEKAMEVIVGRYWKPLYQMAASVLDDFQLCEDIVQETFIKLWSKRKDINFTHSLKAYLFASVRYEMYRQVKTSMRKEIQLAAHNPSLVESYNPHDKLAHEELMESVENIVNRLPNRCRKIYQLSRDHQLSHKEIASKLNVSSKTVENQLTIALRRIRIGISKMLLSLFF